MADASITVDFDDLQLQLALRRLTAAAVNPEVLLQRIGDALVETTERRFRTNEGPDGKPWAGLNPAYEQIRRSGPILVQSGALRDSITFRAGFRELTIGSPVVYARAQQLGATIVPKKAKALRFNLGGGVGGVRSVTVQKVVLPARPYLGISDLDRVTIIEEANSFLGRALGTI